MAVRPMFAAEETALRALSELDQLESGYRWCMASGYPEAVAIAIRMLGCHLLMTLKHLQLAMVITESEQRLLTAEQVGGPAE